MNYPKYTKEHAEKMMIHLGPLALGRNMYPDFYSDEENHALDIPKVEELKIEGDETKGYTVVGFSYANNGVYADTVIEILIRNKLIEVYPTF